MSPPSWIFLPPPAHSPIYVITEPQFKAPWVIQQIPIGYLFTYVSVYASMLLSIHLTLSLLYPSP